jgi:hypothetical protein
MAPAGIQRMNSGPNVSLPSNARLEVSLNLNAKPKHKKLCRYGFSIKNTDGDGKQIPGF